MELSLPVIALVCILLFAVSALYSSVGHGGASGYLAVLSFFAFAPASMSSTALILNVLVSGISFYSFSKAGHFSWRLTWPFLVTSVPAAFIGGTIDVPMHNYSLLLAAVLLFAAFRMVLEIKTGAKIAGPVLPRLFIAFLSGTIIGLISGIVGVGGGIFLSPLILLMKWADSKPTSATSAFFILINSLAGLLGRFSRGSIEFNILAPFLVTAFFGGLIGSHLGANLFSNRTLRFALGVVLVIASFKLLLRALTF